MDIEPQSPPENPILKKLDRERKFSPKDATVFAHPRGARILTPPDGNQLKISIPTAIENAWIAPFLVLPLVIPFLLTTGLAMSFVAPTWDRGGYFNPIPLVISIALALLFTWWLWRACFPRIIIEATREGVTVGKYRFDWRMIEGFRIGNSAGGIERQNTQFIFQGLVLSYGPYGFDLPYMVRKYYAAYYVVWLNDMLDTIGKGDNAGAHDPKSGFKKAMF